MSHAASRPGVIGVDGIRAGWVAAVVGRDRPVRWLVQPRLGDLCSELSGSVVAVDAPVVLDPRYRRACDVAARHRLPGRASTVFPAPTPATVDDWREGVDHAEAVHRARTRGHPAPSRQTWNIVAKVADVQDALATGCAGCVVVECHPEVSFAAMAGRVLPPKASPEGREQRLRALDGLLDVSAALADRPRAAPAVDALDALACAWTACRLRDGQAEGLGDPPALIWV